MQRALVSGWKAAIRAISIGAIVVSCDSASTGVDVDASSSTPEGALPDVGGPKRTPLPGKHIESPLPRVSPPSSPRSVSPTPVVSRVSPPSSLVGLLSPRLSESPTPRSPLSPPRASTSPLAFGPADFKPVREAILAIPPHTFDYEKLCIRHDEHDIFLSGAAKYVCHLREYPAFALLFSRLEGASGGESIAAEKQALEQIEKDAKRWGIDIASVPFDRPDFSVPCYDRGRVSTGMCAAFLEPWFAPSEYSFWFRYASYGDLSLKDQMLGLHSEPARAKACGDVRNLLTLAVDHDWSPADNQGFLSRSGQVILSDPSAIREPQADHVNHLRRILAEVCDRVQ